MPTLIINVIKLGVVSPSFSLPQAIHERMADAAKLSYGPGVFTDEEFLKAAKELNEPDLNGWEFLVECMNTKIYRHYIEVG